MKEENGDFSLINNLINKVNLDITVINYYDRAAAAYESPANEGFYTGIADSLSSAIGQLDVTPESIIEIGSGCAYATSVFRRRFPLARLISLDPSSQMVATAKKLHGGAIFLNGRLQDLPAEESADLIFGNMCLQWLEKVDLEDVGIRLAAGGLAAFTFPLPAEDSFKSRFSGNGLLFQTFREVMDRRAMNGMSRRWRGTDLPGIDIPGLEVIDRREIEIVEQLPAADFINAVVSRGIALALYGPNADSAIVRLTRNTPAGMRVELAWKIGMLIAKKGERGK